MFSFFNKKQPIKQEIIFIMGAPGSGKGTLCKNLVEKKQCYHISSGDLIRKLLKEESNAVNDDLSKIKEAVKKGELLNDTMIVNLIEAEIRKHPEAKSFLIDGCPRTLNQLKVFEEKIKPCDKILFLDSNENILKERLIKRGEIEHRLDDNAEAIVNRMEIYKNQTLPVINYLKNNNSEKFHLIDSSQSIDATSQSVFAIMDNKTIAKVGFFDFLYTYLTCGNFYDAIDDLEKRYDASDFEISLAYITLFYVIQNKEDIKKILTANTITGYQNHNFDISHGHDLNINSTQAFLNKETMEKNPIWSAIHNKLGQSVGDKQLITSLINKHIVKLFAHATFQLDVEFENFMVDFWCEYLFGNKINSNEFKETRNKLLSTLRYTFYDSKLKNIPYVGTQACNFYRYLKKNELAEIDQELKKYIDQVDSGLIFRFKEKLRQSADFPADKIDQAVLDNAFDFVLVLDFIHNVMYQTLATSLKENMNFNDPEKRKEMYQKGLNDAFLFPFRTRVPQQDVKLRSITLLKDVPVFINLLKSGLPHSYGPRSCIGMGVTNWIKEAIWNHLEGMQLRIQNVTYPEERVALSLSHDVPISPERYEIKWQYDRDYLQNMLKHYEFKSVKQFYDVLKIYENPVLSGYIISSFIEKINDLKLDKANLYIATPEVRGIPAAAMVAHILQVPLIIIRKEGKIPGNVIKKEYSTAYSHETLEISADSDVKGKEVILIDDGIATGGTTLTCCDLIKQMGGEIKLILGIINHTYKEHLPDLNKYNIQTLFDFKANKTPYNLVHLAAKNQANLFQSKAQENDKNNTAKLEHDVKVVKRLAG